MTGGSFDGCWGAYPYLPSGLILATDQQEGLFILHTPYGSYEGFGCTNENASNFDPDATINDGSCEFLGCMDSSAENYNSFATIDDGSCEYFCDNFTVDVPFCLNGSSYLVNFGESVSLDCQGSSDVNSSIIFMDSEANIVNIGSIYNTGPIYENTTFSVTNEAVVESNNFSVGEPNHEGSGNNADYSSTVYNGGLLFNCYSEFTLNSVKRCIQTVPVKEQLS